MLGSAVVSLYLTRKLPPAEYGSLGIAFALQSLLMTVSLAGMRAAFLRDYCLHPANGHRVRASFLTTAAGLGWSAAAIGAMIITLLPLSADERQLYYLVLWSHVAAILELGPLFDAAGRQVSAAVITTLGDIVYLGSIAALRGRNYVLPDDVKRCAGPVLAHRVILKPESRLRKITAEHVVNEVVGELAVPTLDNVPPGPPPVPGVGA